MATGDFDSVTFQSGGSTARVMFEYASSPTAATHPKDWPVFTIGSGGNANTLKCLSIGTPADNGDGNYYVDCELTGYAYSGETVTADIPAGFLDDGTASAAVSDGSVTNSSSKTAGDAYTRFLGLPVAVWGIIDRWWDHDDLTAIPLALDAIDNWSGVTHVELTLSLASGVTVNTDDDVTDQGSSVYRVDVKRLLDLYGEGALDYWYLTIDASGASDGTVCTVTEVTITTNDGVSHTMIADGRMSQRVVRKLASPTTLYVDGTATGAADGSSWDDAFTTIAAAETAAGTGTELVKIAPGSYSLTQDFDQSRSTGSHDWLIWDADLGQTGDGSGSVDFSNSAARNVRTLNFLRGMSVDHGTTGYFRFASHYAGIQLASCDCTDKTTNSAPLTVQGVSHISIIGGDFSNGNKFTVSAVAGSMPADILVHQPMLDTLGTSFTGSMSKAIIDGFTEVNGNTDTSPGTHTDGLHGHQTLSVSSVSWVESTKRLSKASGFTNVAAFASSDSILVASLYATGGTGVTTGVEYPLDEKLDASTLQSINDITSGGDQSDIAGSVRGISFEDVIVRNGRQYGGGDAANDKSQNLVLFEGGTRNFVCYNCRHSNAMSDQQVVQLQNFYDNVQLVGLTIAPSDNDDNDDERGCILSSIVSDTDDWHYRGRLLIRNNAMPTAGVGSPGTLDDVANLRAGLFGPNFTSNADPSNPTLVFGTMDGSFVDDGDGGLAAFGFEAYESAPPNLSPSSSSALRSSTGDITPAKDDRWFDAGGNAITAHQPNSVGAMEYLAPEPGGLRVDAGARSRSRMRSRMRSGL